MIRRLTGRILERESDGVLLALESAPGFCLGVNVPDPTQDGLEPGQTVTLHTYFHVRPEELSLYGFLTALEHEIFLHLIRVNGVGPKAACGILGVMSVSVLLHAIVQNEPGVIARAPGVGKRTAQKIIMELADRVADLDPELRDDTAVRQEDEDVLLALTQMGFSLAEAQRALRHVPREVTDVEDRLRDALRQLA